MSTEPITAADDCADAIAKAAAAYWPRRPLSHEQSLSIWRRLSAASLDLDSILNAVSAMYESNPDADRPNWYRVQQLAQAKRRVAGERIERRSDLAPSDRAAFADYRRWLGSWTNGRQKKPAWVAELLNADAAGRVELSDFGRYVDAANAVAYLDQHFGQTKTSEPRSPKAVQRWRRLSGRALNLLGVLRAFGPATEAWRDGWVKYISVADGVVGEKAKPKSEQGAE